MPKERFDVQVSAKLLTWPQVCGCCGGTADRQVDAMAKRATGTRKVRTQTTGWEVPSCASCIEHARLHDRAKPTLQILGSVGAVVAVAALMSGSPIAAAAIFAGGLFFGGMWFRDFHARAKARMKKGCHAPGWAIQYLGWHGTIHTFRFTSRAYAEAFIAANAKKVVG